MKKLECFLVVMDIEKAFDSLDQNFLIYTLEKYGFSKNFILAIGKNFTKRSALFCY